MCPGRHSGSALSHSLVACSEMLVRVLLQHVLHIYELSYNEITLISLDMTLETMTLLQMVIDEFSVEISVSALGGTLITVCACSLLQPSLLLGHVLIVSGDFTVTYIMTVVLCPATASALRGNTVLTELRLAGCGIDAEGTSHLVQALRDITTLRVLDLSGNTVDSQGARHLGMLSGRVWGYRLTCNIRQCQCATTNREMSIVQNVSTISW